MLVADTDADTHLRYSADAGLQDQDARSTADDDTAADDTAGADAPASMVRPEPAVFSKYTKNYQNALEYTISYQNTLKYTL